MIPKSLVKTNSWEVNNISGIEGNIYFLVKYTAKNEGIAKTKAVLYSIRFFLAFLIVPTKDVVPTTNNEYAVAVIGFTCNTYTIIGTVSIDPPPPVSPKTTPISRAPITPYMLRSSKLFL